jgi:hypothetical protein
MRAHNAGTCRAGSGALSSPPAAAAAAAAADSAHAVGERQLIEGALHPDLKTHRLPSRRAVRHCFASVDISSSSMLIMLAMLAARFMVAGLQHSRAPLTCPPRLGQRHNQCVACVQTQTQATLPRRHRHQSMVTLRTSRGW